VLSSGIKMRIPKMASYPAARITCPSMAPPVLNSEPRHSAVPWRMENSDITVDMLGAVVIDLCVPRWFLCLWCLAHAGAVILEPSAVVE
jgi:hypothetical protein